MKVLGEVKWHNKDKELVIEEENVLFKYYVLELIGTYVPSTSSDEEIIFDNNILEDMKLEMKNLLLKLDLYNIVKQMIYKKEIIKKIGRILVLDDYKDVVAKKEGKIINCYYLNLIGVHSIKIPGETIIFREDTLQNTLSAQIKDVNEKDRISEFEKEQIKEFLEKINIRNIFREVSEQEKGVIGKTRYNTHIKESSRDKKQENKNRMAKQQQLVQQQGKQWESQQKNKNTIKDINIKQEIDLDTRVTDMSDLGQILQDNMKMPKLSYGDEGIKIGIVESDDLRNLRDEKGNREQGHSSRFETVMITKKGEVHALNLENDTQEGNNPTEKNYQIKQDDTVKKGDVLTRLKVGDGTIGIEKGKYGEIEVYHSPKKTIGGNEIEGNKSLDRQLETSNAKNVLRGTNIESLKLAQEYNDGYRSVEEGYQEINEHKKQNPNCKTNDIKNLDGKKYTQSHTHPQQVEEAIVLSDGKTITYSELATRWGFYKDGKPDTEFVKEKIEEKKKDEKNTEDVINELDEEYEDPRINDRRR